MSFFTMKTFVYHLLPIFLLLLGCDRPNKSERISISQNERSAKVKYDHHASFPEVKKIASEVLDIELDSIKPETKLVDIGVKKGIEDISYMELVMHVEAEFEIEIPDNEANKFTTIGEICEYVDKKALR
ncbi:acyl carrier protein [Thermoflexibacter ruber]|uniref:Acyl carrier protein n=2 Tax=Thermoflexibacter ruber TaxID=1003 RepID=A0A1I2IW61_9BACT|nr:acyl carrier protein [Thermoflexibacter ruber]